LQWLSRQELDHKHKVERALEEQLVRALK
jgi:hypothetical protein